MAFVTGRSVCAFWLVAAVACGPARAAGASQAQGAGERGSTTGAAAFDQSLQGAPDEETLPAELHRQVVPYPTPELPGTIVIDTPHTFLYYILGDGQAVRYGIGVGREGFAWSGVQRVSRKAVWPSWAPPPEMIKRQQYLPRWVAGGPDNPLGARALYLGNTEYRIHGTNDPSTIGQNMSSGCIRLTNEDIIDLYGRTNVGTKVVVLPATAGDDALPADDRRATSRRASHRHAAARRAQPHRALTHRTAPAREPSAEAGAGAAGTTTRRSTGSS